MERPAPGQLNGFIVRLNRLREASANLRELRVRVQRRVGRIFCK